MRPAESRAARWGDATSVPTAARLNRNAIGGVVGNVLEWYDFAVFGYFAPVIGAQFFPAQNRVAALINTFGVFAAGYLMRPIGGAIFGHIGDRLGRKHALQLSVMMMALPTTLVGCLPTAVQIGIAAPLLLVLLRLVQGVSVGGELIGSFSFVTESAPSNRRGLLGALSFCAAIGGILLGSLATTTVHGLSSPAFLQTWGWRLPFLGGCVVGGLGFWMRRGMAETADFERTRRAGGVERSPVVEALRSMPGRIVHLAGAALVVAGGFYMLFVWWPTYLTHIIEPPVPHALIVNTLSMLVLLVLTPAMGWLSDLVGRRAVLVGALGGLLMATYPLFLWTDHRSFSSAVASQALFAVLMGGVMGPLPAMAVEMFPTRMRFSGIAVGYNLALAVIGGTTPLVCTWLIARTGDITAPAYYLMLLTLVCLGACLRLPARADDRLP
jgi:MHS family proline/betaine transporter-like MFS transporter